MQPADSAFHAYRARQQVRVVPDPGAGLLGCQSLYGKVAGLSKDVARKIELVFVLYYLAKVTAKAALRRFVVVAGHRLLQDVSSYYQKAGEIVRVQELPGALAPFAVGVLAYQLSNLEVFVKLADDLFSV